MVETGEKIYALYFREDLITMGTLEEISKERGISILTLRYYRTPANLKRYDEGRRHYILIELGDENDF